MEAVNSRCVLVEHIDARGRTTAQERIELRPGQTSLTIGRSLDADVTLSEEHAAAFHARIDLLPDGRILASDAGTINGIIVGGQRHRHAEQLHLPRGELQIGRTRLRLRTSWQELAPEKPELLRPATLLHSPRWLAAGGLAVLAARSGYSTWLDAPSEPVIALATSVGGMLLLLGLWAGLWSLLTRVIQHEWRLPQHVAIAAWVIAAVGVCVGALNLAGYMLALSYWQPTETWLAAVALGAALLLHLRQASSMSVRRAALAGALATLLVGGASHWVMRHFFRSDVNYVDADMRIYPPGTRLVGARGLGVFMKEAAALREAAEEQRKANPPDEEDEEE